MDEGKELLYKVIDNKLIKLSNIDNNACIYNNVNLVELSSSIKENKDNFANVTDDILDKVVNEKEYVDLLKKLKQIRDLYLGKKDYNIQVMDKEEFTAAINTFTNLLDQKLESTTPEITKVETIKVKCDELVKNMKTKGIIDDIEFIKSLVLDYDQLRYNKNMILVMDYITKHNLKILNKTDVVDKTVDTKLIRRVQIDERIKDMLEKLKITYDEIPNYLIGELKRCDVDEVLETYALIKKTKAENYGILHFINKDNKLAKLAILLYATPESIKALIDSIKDKQGFVDMDVLKIIINQTLSCFFIKNNEYFKPKFADFYNNIKYLRSLGVNYKLLIKKCPLFMVTNNDVLVYTLNILKDNGADPKTVINKCYKTLAIDPSLILENIETMKKYGIKLDKYFKDETDKYNLLKTGHLNMKLSYIMSHFGFKTKKIDTNLINKIIINKVYKECPNARIVWSD